MTCLQHNGGLFALQGSYFSFLFSNCLLNTSPILIVWLPIISCKFLFLLNATNAFSHSFHTLFLSLSLSLYIYTYIYTHNIKNTAQYWRKTHRKRISRKYHERPNRKNTVLIKNQKVFQTHLGNSKGKCELVTQLNYYYAASRSLTVLHSEVAKHCNY